MTLVMHPLVSVPNKPSFNRRCKGKCDDRYNAISLNAIKPLISFEKPSWSHLSRSAENPWNCQYTMPSLPVAIPVPAHVQLAHVAAHHLQCNRQKILHGPC